jgi:hypothetical protein
MVINTVLFQYNDFHFKSFYDVNTIIICSIILFLLPCVNDKYRCSTNRMRKITTLIVTQNELDIRTFHVELWMMALIWNLVFRFPFRSIFWTIDTFIIESTTRLSYVAQYLIILCKKNMWKATKNIVNVFHA